MADLYSEQIKLPSLSGGVRELHLRERKKWMEEAKNDLTSADDLKPPGIDVPAKLAETHIQ